MKYMLLLLTALCSTGYAEELFPEDDSINQCTIASCEEDSIGRIQSPDGDKWKKGADGIWRSEDNKNRCRWSEALGTYVCEK